MKPSLDKLLRTWASTVRSETEQALLDGQKAIMSTELLAGEDPALLPGPDRVELYPVLDVVDINQAPASA